MEKMKANELRIGNLIRQIGQEITREYLTVLGIHENKVGLMGWGELSFYDINEFEPIPLTEEWLIKFGFEKCGDYFNSENLDVLQSPSKKNFLLSVGTEYTIGEPFEFVHQLQNINFALNGEELTIK